MSRLSNDPQIKSAHSGYRDQAIGIMSIQCKSSQLGICLETNIKRFTIWISFAESAGALMNT